MSRLPHILADSALLSQHGAGAFPDPIRQPFPEPRGWSLLSESILYAWQEWRAASVAGNGFDTEVREMQADAATGAVVNGAFKVVSMLTVVLFLLQSVLAAQGFWRAAVYPDLIEVHGIVGNAAFLVVIVQTGLALYGATRNIVPPRLALINIAILGLVVAQIGLGYVGRENAIAVSWHVPNGVLLFGLAVLNATLAVTRLPAEGA